MGRAGQEGAMSMSSGHCQLCGVVPAPVCGVGSSRWWLPVAVARVLGAGCETREADLQQSKAPVCPISFLLNDSC